MIRIGRPINGVTINGLEYILDENGREMRFADKAAASAFLRGKGFTDDELENSGIVFSEVPGEAEDKFYANRESDTIRWLYYNPDSSAGGQYVENIFGYDLIREAADAEDFFGCIGERCKQYLIDIGTDYFPDYDELFETVPGDFEDCTEATRTALIAAANAALTEGRTLITRGNIEIDRELFIEDDHINAYIAAWFDVDQRFSTDTADSDFIAVELADSERAAILEKLKEAGLDECIAEMRQDSDEGMTMT
jgi:hypothetical protein